METLLGLNLGCGDFPFEPPFVNIGKEDLRAEDPEAWEGCEFLRHDLLTGIPYPDGSVATIHMGYVLCCMAAPDFTSLLTETWRVLAPGGTVMLLGVENEDEDSPAHVGNLRPLLERLGYEVDGVHFDAAKGKHDPAVAPFIGPIDLSSVDLTLIGYWLKKPDAQTSCTLNDSL